MKSLNNFTTYLLYLFISFLIVTFASPCTAEDNWGPWEAEGARPVRQKKSSDKWIEGNILKLGLHAGLRFFQKTISRVDGDRCPMYPTCSGYGRQALKKHGAAIGLMMTADRLMHEVSEQNFAPLIKKWGHFRYLDTISDNDFWWYKKKNNEN